MTIPEPTDEEREYGHAAIRNAMAQLAVVRPGTIETALFLLDEAKAGLARARAASSEIESKAASLLGIVAGASSALGIFEALRDGTAIATTPPMIAAFLLVVVAFTCLVYILRTKRIDDPIIGRYISVAMITEDNRAALALALARFCHKMGQQVLDEICNEPRAFFAARAATITAAVLVLGNAAALNHIVPMRTIPAPIATPSVLPPSTTTVRLNRGVQRHSSPPPSGGPP